MKFSSYRNYSHICSFTYFITAVYKSTIYVMHWYNTVSTIFFKLFGPYFHITAFIIIVNLKVKPFLIVQYRLEPSNIS